MLFYNIFSQLGVTHEALLACLAAAIIIVVSLVSHEVAHGLVALWNGDDTAKRSGTTDDVAYRRRLRTSRTRQP